MLIKEDFNFSHFFVFLSLFFPSLSPITLNSAPRFPFFPSFLGSRRDMKQRFSVDREKKEKGNRGKLERVVGETGPIMARTRILVDRWGPPFCGAGYQRREIILFLTTTMSAMTSRVNQQFGNIRSLAAPTQVDSCIMPIINVLRWAFSGPYSLPLLS